MPLPKAFREGNYAAKRSFLGGIALTSAYDPMGCHDLFISRPLSLRTNFPPMNSLQVF